MAAIQEDDPVATTSSGLFPRSFLMRSSTEDKDRPAFLQGIPWFSEGSRFSCEIIHRPSVTSWWGLRNG